MRETATKLFSEHDFRSLCKVDAQNQITEFKGIITRAGIESVHSNYSGGEGRGEEMYMFKSLSPNKIPRALQPNKSILKSPTPHFSMPSRRLVLKARNVSNDVQLTPGVFSFATGRLLYCLHHCQRAQFPRRMDCLRTPTQESMSVMNVSA